MSDRDALLRAILTSPDDDTPRLMYADWCEENGEGERAEFIRVQIEAARCQQCGGTGMTPIIPGSPIRRGDAVYQCEGCSGALRRGRELRQGPSNKPPDSWGTNEWDWGVKDVASWTAYHNWHRGFLSSITCEWADLLKHADTLTASQPIEDVYLTDNPWTLGGNFGWIAAVGAIRTSDDIMICDKWPGLKIHLTDDLTAHYRRSSMVTIEDLRERFPYAGL